MGRRICFDTNIIVAGFLVDHEMHGICHPWLCRANDREFQALLSVHSLAEVYSVVTRLPKPYRLSAQIAQRLILENLSSFERVELTSADYESVLELGVRLGIVGGGIYDALIAKAAIVGNADRLLTSNAKHFTRLGEDIARLVQGPEIQWNSTGANQ